MSDATNVRSDGMESNGFNTDTLEALKAGVTPARSERAPCAASEPNRFGDLYGASEVMQELFRMLGKVAPSQAVVLIKGASGTGKELAASTLHKMSGLGDKPFVAVNCGAFPANLVEAELFGHERGGFTGAVRLKKGCFERAAGGTLFLDEVTEMPLDMQVKLLRVLETGRFCRVGGDEEIEVKVRVIAATNRCPQEAVNAGSLRSDLLYRLSVIPIVLPALCDRGSDIDLLAKLFLDQLNEEGGTDKGLFRCVPAVSAHLRLAGQRARAEKPGAARVSSGRRRARPAGRAGNVGHEFCPARGRSGHGAAGDQSGRIRAQPDLRDAGSLRRQQDAHGRGLGRQPENTLQSSA